MEDVAPHARMNSVLRAQPGTAPNYPVPDGIVKLVMSPVSHRPTCTAGTGAQECNSASAALLATESPKGDDGRRRDEISRVLQALYRTRGGARRQRALLSAI